MLQLIERKKLELKENRFQDFSNFINKSIEADRAFISNRFKNIIKFDDNFAKYIIFGNDKENNLFIGFQEEMFPLFNNIPWEKVFFCFKTNIIYLLAEERKMPLFAIGFKVNKVKSNKIKSNILSKKTINIKKFKVKNSVEVELYNNNIKSNLEIEQYEKIEKVFNFYKVKGNLEKF